MSYYSTAEGGPHGEFRDWIAYVGGESVVMWAELGLREELRRQIV